MLVELGVIGLLSLIGVIGLGTAAAWSLKGQERRFWMLFLGGLFALMLFDVWVNSPITWLLPALAVAVAQGRGTDDQVLVVWGQQQLKDYHIEADRLKSSLLNQVGARIYRVRRRI
jgi:uncharacterized SAM-binding protein YcdF (DUF218 family)